MHPKRIARYYYLKFLHLKGNPQSLALGISIGVFIGITPTIPLRTIAILIITLLTKANTFAAILAGAAVSNPLTYVPQYYCALVIGNIITPYKIDWDRFQVMLENLLSSQSVASSFQTFFSFGIESIIVLMTGGVVLALPAAIISYFLSLTFFIRIRRSKKKNGVLP
jgi:uncharacterized protein (DUF2062 family)